MGKGRTLMAFTLTPSRGWRTFRCPTCGHHWGEATRDCHSPSGDSCPICYEWLVPTEPREDPSLAVDSNLNLTAPWDERVHVIARGQDSA